jgi:cation-transporting P-type ATPase I
VVRPRPLAPGPIERWADGAAVVGAGAFAAGYGATRDVRRSAALVMGALPKPAQLARQGFAAQLGCALGRRGAIVVDPLALRRLDRTQIVVLDSDVLRTGEHLLGEICVLPDADAEEVTARLHRMFRAVQALAPRQDDGWHLAPIDDLPVPTRQAGQQRRHLEQSRPVAVLGLARGTRLMALASVVPEPVDCLEALVGAARRSGARLLVAGDPGPAGFAAGETVPGGDALFETVRGLQLDGSGVLLVSRRARALAAADVGVGVGVGTSHEGVPWGAHVLVGTDLLLAALLIEACAAAATVSRRGAALAQAASGVAGVAVATNGVPAAGSRSLLSVNLTSAVALGHGVWSAIELTRRPLAPSLSHLPWHAMPADAVLDRLAGSPDGLDAAQLRRRRDSSPGSGSDQVVPRGLLAAAADELANPLTPILAAGSALSAAVGSIVDAGLVAGVTLASALLGGVQRRGTDAALADLLGQSAVSAHVLRQGGESQVPADQLVPATSS